jgi:hypothetical protein
MEMKSMDGREVEMTRTEGFYRERGQYQYLVLGLFNPITPGYLVLLPHKTCGG